MNYIFDNGTLVYIHTGPWLKLSRSFFPLTKEMRCVTFRQNYFRSCKSRRD